MKRLFSLLFTGCATLFLVAACHAPALEEEIKIPQGQEKPEAVSEQGTIPFSITVNTESTRVSYAGDTYAFKTGDQLHVVGMGDRTDVGGYLTAQNNGVWSGNLSYNGTAPDANTMLSITLIHADNTDVSTYGTGLVGVASEGSTLLRDAVERYSLFTVNNVSFTAQSVTLLQQAAFLEVTFTFDFDGSHEVQPGQALVDLEIDGKEFTESTQFYSIDSRNEDFQVHFVAVVPGGKSTNDFILMVGDREVEFSQATLTRNNKYTVERTVVYGPQLGDPFWSDGTYGRLNHADPNASIVGIIVYVNHNYADSEKARIENAITEKMIDPNDPTKTIYGHGLVMALKNVTVDDNGIVQKGFKWSGTNGNQKCTAGFIENPSQVMDSPYFSGLENTNNIIQALGNGNDSAASLAKNYDAPVAEGKSSGWFLPSIGQWMYTISIDGFGNAEHADEWINGNGNNWLKNGNVTGDLVYVKKCDNKDLNVLVKALNDRLAKLKSDFSSYNFDYDAFGDPSSDNNISDNYWTSTEKKASEAIRMNLGTVEQWQGEYYSTIKAKGETKTNRIVNYGIGYELKVRPFLAF